VSAEHLIICGASTRAAAFSALRAGLKPWCIDLFADADLRAKCPVMQIPRDQYPHGLPEMIQRHAPRGPWMYVGGLENHRSVIRAVTRDRVLWGTGHSVVKQVRDPQTVANTHWPTPEVRLSPQGLPCDGSWLVKPKSGSGGRGIYPWRGRVPTGAHLESAFFFQKLVEGRACSALFLTVDRWQFFVGASRQLVGEPWLHAAPYAYCGSVGPLSLPRSDRTRIMAMGHMIWREAAGLQYLWGVDCVLRDGIPWIIEINPRYTASAEVLEYAFDASIFSWYPLFSAAHWRPVPCKYSTPIPELSGFRPEKEDQLVPVIGKAILFAKDSLLFPADGPWSRVLREPPDVRDMPPYADIPIAGTPIAAGQPILTFFAGAHSEEACLEELKRIAAELDCWLYNG
jgi:predicted ATP-grasp superfamily ATP-dependent carboligase